jgi:hypothetical protein
MSGHPVQEEDRIASGKILAVGLISIAIFAVGAVWAISIQNRTMGGTVEEPLAGTIQAAYPMKPEVGIVYQWPFNMSRFGETKHEEKRAWLESYGWVDKNAGVVHLPIDVAMKKLVAEGHK